MVFPVFPLHPIPPSWCIACDSSYDSKISPKVWLEFRNYIVQAFCTFPFHLCGVCMTFEIEKKIMSSFGWCIVGYLPSSPPESAFICISLPARSNFHVCQKMRMCIFFVVNGWPTVAGRLHNILNAKFPVSSFFYTIFVVKCGLW